MSQLVRHYTRDGGLIQVGVRYYIHAHLHDPRELLTLVRAERVAASWLDGQPTQIWLLHDARGRGYMCEAWQLSRIPHPALFAELRGDVG